MSTSVGVRKSRKAWEPPASKPLDEPVWRAWQIKGRAQDRRGGEMRVKAVKWFAIAALLTTAGLWSHLPPYEVAVKLAVAVCAVVAMSQELQARQYAFAVMFAALVLLFNPVVAVFGFSGDWQRALVAASIIPFAASLVGRDVKLVHNA
jgi:hypothetical protein